MQALNEQVIIKLEDEHQTDSGIIIESKQNKKSKWGKVISVGQGKNMEAPKSENNDGKAIMNIKVGDRVCVLPFYLVEMYDWGGDDNTYYAVSIDNIIAKKDLDSKQTNV